VTYEVHGVNGRYGVSVIDYVSGGCQPSGEHRFVILDDAAYKTSESFTYTAPASGSCTFHGDYKFGTDPIELMPDTIVTIEALPCTPSWSCTGWSGCEHGKQTRECSDSFSTVCEGGRDPHITISVGYWGVSDFLCKM